MGPRTAAVSAGGQQGFIQRKTALSKSSRLKSGDSTADIQTPRGPGRYSTVSVSVSHVHMHCKEKLSKLVKRMLVLTVNTAHVQTTH